MNVTVGSTTRWSTILIGLLAVITTLGVVWDDMRQRLEAAGVPPDWTARASVIIGLAVISGRYLQAVAALWGRPPSTPLPPAPVDESPDVPGRELTPEEVAALTG